MSSDKKFSLCLARDLELNTNLSKGSFIPVISVKADDLKVDKNVEAGVANPVDLKAIRDAVRKLKSNNERAMIEFKPAGHRVDFHDRITTNSNSLTITVLWYFQELNNNNVLESPFIRIDGAINATYNSTTLLNEKINYRVSLKDLFTGKRHEVQLGSALNQHRNNQVQMKLELSIWLEWTQKSISFVKQSGDSIVLKMFVNESTKDYTIVASNGVKVKCHGLILAAQSLVLEKMINPSNGMKESESKVIEAKDISEDGVKCLLLYLYGLKMPVEGCSCALISELFQAAHYYELEHLGKSLEAILLHNDDGWFTPDSILELYFFVKLLDQFGALRDYLLQIMTRMSLEIRKCEWMQTLSKNDSVDLLWKLFDVSNNIKEEAE